jgi:regulator of replication initiation timing
MAVNRLCPSAQQCANLDTRIQILESELTRLRQLDEIREDLANLLREENEELRQRLLALENTPSEDRFRRAKVAISKALHPNNFAHDEQDQAIRTEIFKQLWPEIERIEKL